MISTVRKLLGNWVARAFFVILVLVFMLWGVSNVVTLISSNTTIAHIGGRPIDITAVQTAYQNAVNQARQNNPAELDLATRRNLASGALSDVLRQQALQIQEEKLGISAPPAAMRQMVESIPAFQTNNVFDQAKFNQILQANNQTADQFLASVRQNVLGEQLVLPVTAASAGPQELVDQLFAFVAEQRFAETVSFSATGTAAPPAPSDAVLQRYWRNHQQDFAAPEYREIQLVLLSPALLAPHETVSDASVAAAYARATAGQAQQALRNVQAITTSDQAKAASFAQAWNQGADWTKMQSLAKTAGAAAVELDSAQQAQFPSPEFGAAVFAASPGAVTGPVKDAFGYVVFKVTNITSSVPPQADLQAKIKQQLQLQAAQAEVAQDVDSLQDALAGQTPLDKLPGNIGLIALQGMLDVKGNAADGSPAPIPGGDTLKTAIVTAAFAAHPNAPAQLINGPDGSYFALTVNKVIPASIRPYQDVKDKVTAAWTADQISRAAEARAAALMQAVNAGQHIDDLANAGGYSVSVTPPITRNAPPAGVDPQLVQILFTLKPGQATMIQTKDGFEVAALTKIVKPTPAQDPADYAQVQTAMSKSIQDDLGQSFIAGLEVRDNIKIDQKLFAQIYQ